MDLRQLRAKRKVERGEVALKTWWAEKYGRPAGPALFLDWTEAELYQERYEDLYERKRVLEARIDHHADYGDPSDDVKPLMDELRGINEILGEHDPNLVEDPLADKWDRELAEGKIPDLTEGLPDGNKAAPH